MRLEKSLIEKLGGFSWVDKTRPERLGGPATSARKILRSLIQYSVYPGDGKEEILSRLKCFLSVILYRTYAFLY